MKTQASQIRLQFNADMKPELIITLASREGLESINKNEAVEMFARMYRLTEEVGKTKNGECTQFICFFGSSGYDTLQMSRLLDGVIQEAHDIGIETPTRSEIELMKSQWR